MVLKRTTVHWITSFVLKCLSVMLLLTKSTSYLFSLTLKKPMIQHGSMAFWQTSGILVSRAIFPCLFRASCVDVLSELEWALLCQRWGSIQSPALFSIKISNIVNTVLKDTDCSLLVDYFALCVCGTSR